MKSQIEKRLDKFAPYWASGLFVLGVTGLSTIWFDLGDFGKAMCWT